MHNKKYFIFLVVFSVNKNDLVERDQLTFAIISRTLLEQIYPQNTHLCHKQRYTEVTRNC